MTTTTDTIKELANREYKYGLQRKPNGISRLT